MAEPGMLKINSLAVARENVESRNKTSGYAARFFRHKHKLLSELGIYDIRNAEDRARALQVSIDNAKWAGGIAGFVVAIAPAAYAGSETHQWASNFMNEGFSGSTAFIAMAAIFAPAIILGRRLGALQARNMR